MSDLPKRFKACCYAKPGENKIEICDVDMPEPGPGDVLIRLTHSGVCHSDYAVMMNGWPALTARAPTQAGQIGGHEGVGHIVKLGPGAETMHKVGDRVGIKWIAAACGSCGECLSDREGSCTNGRKISGYYTPGTFQQYALGPANYVTRIPDSLDSAAAAPMLCGGITVYAALRKTELRAGQTVALLGAGGGLGHLAVQVARGMGFRVIGVDHSSKAQLVVDSGAEAFVAIDDGKDVVEQVKKATDDGTGVHAAIPMASSNAAYAQAVNMLRTGGRLVCVGIPEGDVKEIAGISPAMMIFKQLSIMGSAVGNRRDAVECLDMAARGVVKLHYRVEKMDRLEEVFEQMAASKLQGRVVLDLA